VITAFDLYHKEIFTKILRRNSNIELKEDIPVVTCNLYSRNYRDERLTMLEEFFLEIIDSNYHKFVLDAQNLSTFVGILILDSLVYMCEDNGFKLEPFIRDNKIILIKIRFGLTSQNRYRYYIEFHDSLLILITFIR